MNRGNSGKGFVAIDDVEFRYIEACAFTPNNAKPVPTTVLPTTSIATTIEPTEPPDCKLYY